MNRLTVARVLKLKILPLTYFKTTARNRRVFRFVALQVRGIVAFDKLHRSEKLFNTLLNTSRKQWSEHSLRQTIGPALVTTRRRVGNLQKRTLDERSGGQVQVWLMAFRQRIVSQHSALDPRRVVVQRRAATAEARRQDKSEHRRPVELVRHGLRPYTIIVHDSRRIRRAYGESVRPFRAKALEYLKPREWRLRFTLACYCFETYG